jgi:tRNA A-37 threonylcarbamoyl transferase component Bud32
VIDARAHLVARGLLEPTEDVDVTPLSGGVSGEVVAVRGDTIQVVVKTPLDRLKVAHDWQADRRRVVAEAAALRIAAQITPRSVPRVVDLDSDAYVIVLEASDPDWLTLRDQLMLGICDHTIGETLGSALAQWHTATQEPELLPDEIRDLDAFVALRIDPFYRFVAAQYPELAGDIGAAADALLHERTCLVHGDLSPKNVLVGPGQIWVLDWEVAHFGCPVFDLSFMLTHLVLKTLHQPQFAEGYARVAEAFLGAYRDGIGGGLPSERQVTLNVGCLLLARVDGKSPALYLSAEAADRARSLAVDLVNDPPPAAENVWERV